MIKEVAAHAGVSLGTVSRVINGHSNVNPELRARVERSIVVLGYRPNYLARSLRSRRSKSFGVVIPDVTNPFFGELVKGLEREASKAGYTVILGNSEERPEAERVYLEMLVDRMVDGLILVPTTETRKIDVRTKVPLILVDRSLAGHSFVGSDHRDGAAKAVDHLVGLGHRVIACIAGPKGVPVATERYQGYQRALKLHNIAADPDVVEFATFDYDSGYRATSALLDRRPDVSAIFASSDQQAIGAIRAITDRGLRVPDNVSVFGFDDIPLAALINPRLSTVRQSVVALSQAALRSILAQQDDKSQVAKHRLATELILRDSCAPPSKSPPRARRRG